MGINYWIMEDKHEIVTWYAKFPEGKMTDPWEVLPFVQRVLELAEREEVYRVQRAPWESGDLDLKLDLEYRAYPGGPSYGDYIEQVLTETDKLIFFEQLSAIPNLLPEYRVIAPARLSYYDIDGTLVDKEVEDVGELLRRVRPPEVDLPDDWQELSEEYIASEIEYVNRRYKATGSAVFVDGRLVPKDSFSDYGTYLSIRLWTDIWFPKVGGYLVDSSQYENRIFKDNRELALRHTPRLNRFLTSVRELTVELGGTWIVDPPYPEDEYARQLSEYGIDLDL
jgi:hypothetical protein